MRTIGGTARAIAPSRVRSLRSDPSRTAKWRARATRTTTLQSSDDQQEDQAGAVGGQHEALEPAVVDPGGDQVGGDPEEEREQLLAEVDG
jgi:hypothetical protein